MTPTPRPYGPAFMAYVQTHAGSDSLARIFETAGISRSNATRWASGENQPTLEAIVAIADVLDRPRLEAVAYAIGEEDDLTRAVPPTVETIEDVVARSMLSPGEREALELMVQALRLHVAGSPDSTVTSTARPVRKRPRAH